MSIGSSVAVITGDPRLRTGARILGSESAKEFDQRRGQRVIQSFVERRPHTRTNSGYETVSNRFENDHKSCFLSNIKVEGSVPIDGVSTIEKVARTIVLLSYSESALYPRNRTVKTLTLVLGWKPNSVVE